MYQQILRGGHTKKGYSRSFGSRNNSVNHFSSPNTPVREFGTKTTVGGKNNYYLLNKDSDSDN